MDGEQKFWTTVIVGCAFLFLCLVASSVFLYTSYVVDMGKMNYCETQKVGAEGVYWQKCK